MCAFIGILNLHIPEYENHSVERDAVATARAILAEMQTRGWLSL